MKHDPLCSEGEVRGDQVMDCDCAGLLPADPSAAVQTEPLPNGAEVSGLRRARAAVSLAAKSTKMPQTWLVVVTQAIDAEIEQCRAAYLEHLHQSTEEIKERLRNYPPPDRTMQIGSGTQPSPEHSESTRRSAAQKSHSHMAPEPASAEKKK